MSLVQPETFVLTDAEAAAVQSAHMARQARIARANPLLIAGSVAVPVLMLAAVYAIDLVGYGGEMPGSLFATLPAVFVAGMLTQALTYKLTMEASKKRMRQTTRQTFAPRSVRISEEGIEQALPEVRALHAWTGIDRVEETRGLILLWAGNLLAMAVPARAFPAAADARAFVEECRRRAGQS